MLLLVPCCLSFSLSCLPKMNATARRSLAKSTLWWYNSPKLKSLPSLSLVSVQRMTQQPNIFGTARINRSSRRSHPTVFLSLLFLEKNQSRLFVRNMSSDPAKYLCGRCIKKVYRIGLFCVGNRKISFLFLSLRTCATLHRKMHNYKSPVMWVDSSLLPSLSANNNNDI